MEGSQTKYVLHMAGIIPIQNGTTNDGYPWPKCLTPLYENYTALHRSILECAMAGCSSIWVVAEKKHIPLLKSVVGSHVEDPILAQLPVEFKENFTVRIPVWYTSVPVKDLGKRDCFGRTILAGAEYATFVASKLSKGFKPDKFYVSFPDTVYSPWILQNSRKTIKSKNRNYFLTIDNKSIKDGIKAGFTMLYEDYERYKEDFRSRDNGEWTGSSLGNLRRRPVQERNLAAKLTLDEVFRSATLEAALVHDLKNSYDISTWDGYAKYISSSHHYKMPKKVKYFRYNKIKDLETRLIDCGDYNDYSSED